MDAKIAPQGVVIASEFTPVGPRHRRHHPRPAGAFRLGPPRRGVDRDRALSASYDDTLRLWDLATGDTIRVLRGHSSWINHVVAFDRDRALSASWDHTLRLWDLATGDTIRVLQGHSGWVRHVVALDRDRALSASDDDTLRLCDLATGTIRVLQGHSGPVSHVVEPVPATPAGLFSDVFGNQDAA